MAAILFVLFAIATVPGTGVPELIAALSLWRFAGYAVYHLSFNWWALALLVSSVVPFFFAVRGPRRELWLAVSILGLTVGSVFFFPAANGLISVHPCLAAVTSAVYAASSYGSQHARSCRFPVTKPLHGLSRP